MRFNRQSFRALLAIALVAVAFSVTLRTFQQFYIANVDTSVLHVRDYLNTHIAPDSLVESYDSELFFLLDHHYHYPPDQLHVELLRRNFLPQDVPVDYDPRAADPDYLVIGLFSRLWKLYDPVLATGAFRLLRTFGRYHIYERVR